MALFEYLCPSSDLAKADTQLGSCLPLRGTVLEHSHKTPSKNKIVDFGRGEDLSKESLHGRGIVYSAKDLY